MPSDIFTGGSAMSKSFRYLGGVLLALAVSTASAQPSESPDEQSKLVNPYVYMRDSAGNKVFVQTTFWRNDPAYDARVLKRLSDVMSALEKVGYKRSVEKVVRCRINLEFVNKRWRGKSGAIIACEGTGISEAEVVPSEDPKHVKLVMDAYEKQFKLAKEKLTP
jgi:hypothetical protein